MKRRLLTIVVALIMAMSYMPLVDGNMVTYASSEKSTETLKAVSASCGFDSLAVVDEDGAVWVKSSDSIIAGTRDQYHRPNYFRRVLPNDIVSVKSSIKGYPYSNTNSSEYCQNAALDKSGSLWIWGIDRYHTIGNGETENGGYAYANKPTKVASLENIKSYDISGLNSAAVTENGDLYVWGNNDCYQIGDGTNTISKSPKKIMEDVKSVCVGYSSNGQNACTAAIKSDGSLWMWGFNYNGVLGQESEVNGNFIKEPTRVTDNVREVSIGDGFVLAVKNDDTLWAWGTNDSGTLGTGGTTSISVPTQILSDVKTASAGLDHAFAIKNNGTLYSWGRNYYGQLGNGNTTSSYRPAKIMENVEAICAGHYNSVAIKTDGTIWHWGITAFQYSYNGGYYNNSHYETVPVQVDLTKITTHYEAENQERDIDIAWNDKWLEDTSSVYNHDLAIAGVVLSTAAENNYAVDALNDFGFRCGTAYTDDFNYNYDSNDIDEPACTVGYKMYTDTSGKKNVDIVLICRGTTTMDDIVTDIKAKNDGFLAAGKECYSNFNDAINKIAEYTGVPITSANTRLFITGHSLGGACANIVTMLLADKEEFDLDNIYMYTYASPKVNINWTDFQTRYSVPGAFNVINNCGDIVHYFWNFSYKEQTGTFGNKIITPVINARMGKDIAYNNLYGSQLFQAYAKVFYGDGYENAQSMVLMLKAHFSTTYLAALMSDEPIAFAYKTFRLLSAHCPVDVTVYDEEGNRCGYTENGTAYNDSSSPVRIVVIGDEKYIELPETGEYRVEYTGTDDGTMEVIDQTFDAKTGEVLEEKDFSNITVENGKTFESVIDIDNTVDDTQLFVVNESGEITKEIDVSGNELPVNKTDITQYNISLSETNYIFDGEEKRPEIVVDNLQKDRDYSVTYVDNVDPGTATVIVRGEGSYSGEIKKEFTITGTLTIENVSIDLDACEYTGAQITPDIHVTYNGKPLNEGTDYTLSYGENVELGEGFAFVEGKGCFKGKIKRTFEIVKANYDLNNIGFADTVVPYDGDKHSIEITGNLPEGVTVSYEGNGQTDPGDYTVKAIFTGDTVYHNEIPDMTAVLSIRDSEIDGVTANGFGGTYDGKLHGIIVNAPSDCLIRYGTTEGAYELDSSPTYVDAGDYTVYYEVSREGSSAVTGSVGININKATYDMSGVGFTDKTVTYSGTEQNITITGNLPNGVSVSYTGNGKKEIGSYTITASFKGDDKNYYPIDDKTAVLTIKAEEKPQASTSEESKQSVVSDLPAVTISSVKAAKKAATVKWKKVSKKSQKKIAKIQIQYSTDKSFKSGVKTTTAKKSVASKKIKKLKSKKTYYVRVRAYKKVGNVVHVSKWSKVKKTKIK